MTTDEAEFDVVVVGQRRRRDDRRPRRRAARPADRRAGEDGLLRRLDRPVRRRHLGAGQRGAAEGRRPGHPGAGQRLPGPRRRGPVSGGLAAGAARPGARRCWRSCAPTPRSTSPGCPVTPTTTPRPRAGWRGGAASSRCRSTRGCSGTELAHLNPAYLPAPTGVTITQADYRWLSLGTRHPRAILTAARVSGRTARTPAAAGGARSAWARPWRPACGRAWRPRRCRSGSAPP